MKLAYIHLINHLATRSNSLAPIYLLNNTEPWMQQHARIMIKQASAKAGYHDQLCLYPTTHEDWENVHTVLHSIPLIQDKRLIELDCRQSALTVPIAHSILETYLQSPMAKDNSEQIVLIRIDKMNSTLFQQCWYQAIQKQGIIIMTWPLSVVELTAWIQQYARTVRLNLTIKAASVLATAVGGHISEAYQAIEKMVLLYHTDPAHQSQHPSAHLFAPQIQPALSPSDPTPLIDIQDVAPLLTDDHPCDLFHFIDHLFDGSTIHAIRQLQKLRNQHMEPAFILWAILRELRLLAAIKNQLTATTSSMISSLLKQHAIPQQRHSIIKNYLKTHAITHIWYLLTQAALIDAMIKNKLPGAVWEALEILCLRIQ